MGPGLEENLLSQASTYVRNIQTGKSKKLFYPSETSQAGRGVWSTASYLVKEHRKGKKEKKSWHQYVFLGLARENEDPVG
jgi:hypothetical protein